MGEEKFAQTPLVKAVQGAIAVQPQQSGDLRVATPGGVFQVRWDDNASASALGQLAFFGEFLEVSQLFERWVESCPLEYTSPNAPEVRDVLGTWLLSILDGQVSSDSLSATGHARTGRTWVKAVRPLRRNSNSRVGHMPGGSWWYAAQQKQTAKFHPMSRH